MRAFSNRSILPAGAGPTAPALPVLVPALVPALVLGLSLLLAACGGPAEPPPGAPVEGKPRWRISEAGGRGRSGLLLHCSTPIRVRLRMQSTNSPEDVQPWRTLATGQTLLTWFDYRGIPLEQLEDKAPPEAKADGRTEALAGVVNCHFDDRVSSVRRLVFWARPGHGRLLHLSALPPGRYEDLPLETSIELVTVAMTDYVSGAGKLKRREHTTRLLLPEATSPEDRAEVVRVFLDISPVPDE